ncbi:GNAT family N-acetyltransferase [Microbacterium sp. G2-8]|uniref:GNAT family N-acetyltransferase n=1 Tax=Microbacterium sp. G2-8 TaxID=2842454 RepID=UPI001C8A868E|nr:GNAT family N-acetyltransferase [Microbacterium sp. G2-8]
MPDDLTFTDVPESSRYELRRGDEIVSVLDYRVHGDTVAFTRAFTNPVHRGRGYASVVTERAVDAIAARGGQKVLPVCWYVADWFDDHPGRAELLAAG